MGKAKKKVSEEVEVDPDQEIFLQRALELKEEGNRMYVSRNFKQALACYEQVS